MNSLPLQALPAYRYLGSIWRTLYSLNRSFPYIYFIPICWVKIQSERPVECVCQESCILWKKQFPAKLFFSLVFFEFILSYDKFKLMLLKSLKTISLFCFWFFPLYCESNLAAKFLNETGCNLTKMNIVEQFRKQRCFCRHHAECNQIIATVWFNLKREECMAMTCSRQLKQWHPKAPAAW